MGVFAHRRDSLADVARQNGVARQEQIGICLTAPAPDASPELVEFSEPEPVGAFDDDRVGIRDVKPGLDDRGADQYIGPAFDE